MWILQGCLTVYIASKCLAAGELLESPLEGREEKRIEGGREVAWTGTPKI